MPIVINQDGLVSDFIVTAVAGEDVSVRDTAFVADGTETIIRSLVVTTGAAEAIGGSTWLLQSFKTSPIAKKITAIDIKFAGSDQQDQSITVRIRSSPTGSDLATATVILSSSGSGRSFNFSFNLTVSPSTTYYAVISYGGTSTLDGSASSVYADGSAQRSTNSGSSWGASISAADLYLRVTEQHTDSGKIYKCSSDGAGMIEKFTGFIQATTTAGSTVALNPQLVINGFTGLTIGQRYYVSGTPGALSTSGSCIVGIAVNTTTIIRLWKST